MNGLDILRAARTSGDHMAARDYLLQAGYDDARIAGALDTTPHVVISAARSVLEAIEKRLAVANGVRGQGALALATVLYAIHDAWTSGRWGWRHGGHPTASSYGYAYSAVACGVVVDGDSVLIGLARTGGRVAPFGIGAMSDRATRQKTVERIHQDVVSAARGCFYVSCSIAVAKYLVKGIK